MTTDRIVGGRSGATIAGAAGALAIWIVGMALLALAIRPNAVVAFGAPAQLAQAAIDSDAQMLGAGRAFVTFRPESGRTVLQLYAHGAWLVWPLMSSGCLGRPR